MKRQKKLGRIIIHIQTNVYTQNANPKPNRITVDVHKSDSFNVHTFWKRKHSFVHTLVWFGIDARFDLHTWVLQHSHMQCILYRLFAEIASLYPLQSLVLKSDSQQILEYTASNGTFKFILFNNNEKCMLIIYVYITSIWQKACQLLRRTYTHTHTHSTRIGNSVEIVLRNKCTT